ncbi:hypothetical protein [Streptomyces bohaiensis]|uniref:hypothetical protein n=1 Tax=Streptomyces bohaiensis TaxID=1431344 RepID=UPI003B7B8907
MTDHQDETARQLNLAAEHLHLVDTRCGADVALAAAQVHATIALACAMRDIADQLRAANEESS